jgi:hypothetical protein
VSHARPVVLALVALLLACGDGTKDGNTSTVDFVTLTMYGATATYTDDMPNTSIMAHGSGGDTAVVLNNGGSVMVTLRIPAGATGTVAGSATTIVSGHACEGAVTFNVSKHGTAMLAEVAATFPTATLPCNTPPSSITVSGSFSVTRI